MTSNNVIPRNHNPIVTLYTSHWTPPTEDRKRDVDECLRRNLNCTSIDRIVLLADSTSEHRAGVSHIERLHWLEMPPNKVRCTYDDFFKTVRSFSVTDRDINIVANSDVYFDNSLDVLKTLDLTNICVTLSRWEGANGAGEWLAGDNSHDCWIFQGPVRELSEDVDFPIGTFDCDGRIAWILTNSGYTLINIPHDVRMCHIHDSSFRNAGTSIPGNKISRVPHRRLSEMSVPLRLPESNADPIVT